MSIFRHLSSRHDDPPAHAKRGRKMTFHGSFKHKEDAARKERSTPHAFIIERGGRYLVMTENK